MIQISQPSLKYCCPDFDSSELVMRLVALTEQQRIDTAKKVIQSIHPVTGVFICYPPKGNQ